MLTRLRMRSAGSQALASQSALRLPVGCICASRQRLTLLHLLLHQRWLSCMTGPCWLSRWPIALLGAAHRQQARPWSLCSACPCTDRELSHRLVGRLLKCAPSFQRSCGEHGWMHRGAALCVGSPTCSVRQSCNRTSLWRMIRSAQAMKRMHIWCAAAACTNFGRCEIQPSLLLAQKACAKCVGRPSKQTTRT